MLIFPMLPRLVLNSRVSCLSFSSAWFTDIWHDAWFWRSNLWRRLFQEQNLGLEEHEWPRQKESALQRHTGTFLSVCNGQPSCLHTGVTLYTIVENPLDETPHDTWLQWPAALTRETWQVFGFPFCCCDENLGKSLVALNFQVTVHHRGKPEQELRGRSQLWKNVAH